MRTLAATASKYYHAPSPAPSSSCMPVLVGRTVDARERCPIQDTSNVVSTLDPRPIPCVRWSLLRPSITMHPHLHPRPHACLYRLRLAAQPEALRTGHLVASMACRSINRLRDNPQIVPQPVWPPRDHARSPRPSDPRNCCCSQAATLFRVECV